MSSKNQTIPLVSDVNLSAAERSAILRAAKRWPEASSFLELKILRHLDGGFSSARVYEAEWVSPGSAANDRVILKVDGSPRLIQEVKFSKIFQEAAPSFMKVRAASFDGEETPPNELGCIFYAHAGGHFPGEIKTLSSLCEKALEQKACLDEFLKLLANTFQILRLQLRKGKQGPVPHSAKRQLDFYLKRWLPAAELECRQVEWGAPSRLRLFLADHPAEEFPDFGQPEEADLDKIGSVVAFHASELYLTEGAIYVNESHERCFQITGISPEKVKALVGECSPEVRVEGKVLRTRLSSYRETFESLGFDPTAPRLRFEDVEVPNPLPGFQARVEEWSRRQPFPTYCFGHGDLHGGNVLCVGGTLAVIDHALSGEDHPAWADAARLISSLLLNSIAPRFQADELARIVTLAFRQPAEEPMTDSELGVAAVLLRRAYENAIETSPNPDDSRRELWIDLHHFAWIGLKWGGSDQARIAMILLAGVAVEKIEHESLSLAFGERLRSSLPSRLEPASLIQKLPEHLSSLVNLVQEISEPGSELPLRFREIFKSCAAEQLRQQEANPGRTGGLLGRLLDKALTRSWTYEDTTDASRIRFGEEGLYTSWDRVVLADILLFACLFTWTDEAFALLLDLCNEGDEEVEVEAALVLGWLLSLETTRERVETRPSFLRRIQTLLSRRQLFDFFSMAAQVRIRLASSLSPESAFSEELVHLPRVEHLQPFHPQEDVLDQEGESELLELLHASVFLTDGTKRVLWARFSTLSAEERSELFCDLRAIAAWFRDDNLNHAWFRCYRRTHTLIRFVHILQREDQQDELRQQLFLFHRSFSDLLTDAALKHLGLARELASSCNLALESGEDRRVQELAKESIKHFEKAADHTPLESDDLLSWGWELGQLADQTPDSADQRQLRLQVCDKYQQALQINPDKHEALYNWGIELSRLANLAPEGQAQREFRLQACDKYRQALQIKPDKHEALNNWGNELSCLASLAPDYEAQKEISLQACDKYQQALQIRPDTYEELYNWGTELSRLADWTLDSEAQRELRLQACDKFQRALQAKPAAGTTLNRWGSELSQLAAVSDPKEKGQLWELAGELFARSAQNRGISLTQVYDYACLLALRHQRAEALASLKECIETGEISVEHVRQDSDWSEFRGDPEFEALLGASGGDDAPRKTP